MAAKHARHDMREDKNFKGTDPSETTAQYLYCAATLCHICMTDFFPKLTVHEAWMRKMRKHFKAFKTSVLGKSQRQQSLLYQSRVVMF